MLKKHLLSQSQFEEIISKQDKPRQEYIQWAIENDSPRGVTWEETQTQIIQYEKKLASEGYKYATDKEWFDHMWITAKHMEDSVSEHFIYTISDKKWDEIIGDDKKQLKAIIDKQCARFKKQSEEAQAEIDRINAELQTLVLARTPISELILRKIRRMDVDAKRLELEKQRDYFVEQKKWCDEQLYSMPPKNCPQIDEVINRNGALYVLAEDLIDEMQSGEHDWACQDNMNLYRWASHKYTMNGKNFTAKQMQNSYNKAKSLRYTSDYKEQLG